MNEVLWFLCWSVAAFIVTFILIQMSTPGILALGVIVCLGCLILIGG